jgi:hypothetical protein
MSMGAPGGGFGGGAAEVLRGVGIRPGLVSMSSLLADCAGAGGGGSLLGPASGGMPGLGLGGALGLGGGSLLGVGGKASAPAGPMGDGGAGTGGGMLGAAPSEGAGGGEALGGRGGGLLNDGGGGGGRLERAGISADGAPTGGGGGALLGAGGGAAPRDGGGTELRLGGGNPGALRPAAAIGLARPSSVFWRGAEGGAPGPTLGRDFFASPSNTSKSDPPLSLIVGLLSPSQRGRFGPACIFISTRSRVTRRIQCSQCVRKPRVRV